MTLDSHFSAASLSVVLAVCACALITKLLVCVCVYYRPGFKILMLD